MLRETISWYQQAEKVPWNVLLNHLSPMSQKRQMTFANNKAYSVRTKFIDCSD